MSDATGSESLTGMDSDASAGALLRAAREAAGLHVAALAVSLKVPVRKLEALEADHLEELTDAVFVRALASSVCRALKVDPVPILARLPQTVTPRLDRAASTINASFRAPGESPGLGVMDQLSRPVVLAVLAFLLSALVLIFLPSVQRSAPMRVAENPGAAPTIAVSATAVTQPMEPQQLGAVLQAPVGDTAAALTPSSASMVEPPVTKTPIADVPGEVVPTDSIAIFNARAESWIEVIDARGVTVTRRLLAAGSFVGVSGALPLQVVIGRADSTEVQVRGRPLDLTRFTRDNVARFEVK